MFRAAKTRFISALTIVGLSLILLVGCAADPVAHPTPPPTEPISVELSTAVVEMSVDTTPTPTPHPEYPDGFVNTFELRGQPKDFPDVLMQADGGSIGQVITAWQDYLLDSVLAFEGNNIALCPAGRAYSDGALMVGNLLWSIGPPTPEMAANEMYVLMSQLRPRDELSYVLSYRDNTPTLIPSAHGLDKLNSVPENFEPIPFEVFELGGACPAKDWSPQSG